MKLVVTKVEFRAVPVLFVGINKAELSGMATHV